jgi:hypothetical protein
MALMLLGFAGLGFVGYRTKAASTFAQFEVSSVLGTHAARG